MVATYNLTVYQGSTFSKLLTFKDSNGSTIDLTGSTFSSQLRKTATDATVYVNFTFTLLDQTDPSTKGQVLWQATATQMASIPVKTETNYKKQANYYPYDINWIKADSTTERIIEGYMSVESEVTR